MYGIFGYDYDEIARIIGKSEPDCRQLAVRARRQSEERRPRFEASRTQREQLAHRFFAAVEQGGTHGLFRLLAADMVVYGHGGGKAPSWPHPIHGQDRVSRLPAGLGKQMKTLGLRNIPTEVDEQPGAMILGPEGRLINIVALDIADGVAQTMRSITNPDKRGHLGPLSDVRGLLRKRRGRTPSDPTA